MLFLYETYEEMHFTELDNAKTLKDLILDLQIGITQLFENIIL